MASEFAIIPASQELQHAILLGAASSSVPPLALRGN